MSKFQGADAFAQRLKRIPTALDIAITPAMAAGADQLVHAMQARAPENRWGGHKPWQQPGTLRHNINWKWTGRDKITIRAKPPPQPNLGLWTEVGTRPGVKGESYVYQFNRRHRKKSFRYNAAGEMVSAPDTSLYLTSAARKIYRTHPGTKAQPFFVPVWREMKKALFEGIKAAGKKGVSP